MKQSDITLPDTVPATKALLNDIATSIKEATSKAADLRNTEMTKHAQSAETLQQKARAKVLRTINKKDEMASRTFNILARTAKQSEPQRIDRLEIPTTWPAPGETIPAEGLADPKAKDTEWRSITDPEEVVYYLMLRNQRHFGQAQGTPPFTIDPLRDEFDWANTKPAAAEVYWQAPMSTLPSHLIVSSQVLQQCKAKCKLNAIPAELTLQEFQGKISKWRERTSTSPSG